MIINHNPLICHAQGRHPGIAEVAVLGVPHPELGEAVAALVARSDPALDADKIRRWAAAELAPYQARNLYLFQLLKLGLLCIEY